MDLPWSSGDLPASGLDSAAGCVTMELVSPMAKQAATSEAAALCASMTAFAQARRSAEGVHITVTLKSVNHRHLDLNLHLPPELERWAAAIEKRLRAELGRGHVDVTVAAEAAVTSAVAINEALVDAYLAAHARLTGRLRVAAVPSPGEILALPGIFSPATAPELWTDQPAETLPALLDGALAEALAGLKRMRAGEGQVLVEDIRRRIARLQRAGAAIGAHRQALEADLFERLKRRLATLIGDQIPAERLLQEAALLAERSDISEELTRLDAHLAQFLRLLDEGGEVGRKLDFLLQELNREVNTALSKTSGVAAEGLNISELGVDMKAEIEKIREQVQNLE